VVSVPAAEVADVQTDHGLTLALHIWMLVDNPVRITANLQTLHTLDRGVQLDHICIQVMLATAGSICHIRLPDQWWTLEEMINFKMTVGCVVDVGLFLTHQAVKEPNPTSAVLVAADKAAPAEAVLLK
jgi:hypothetical protein